MLKKIHIIGLGLMGTNLGIKLVNSGIEVSGSDILEKNVSRAKELAALSLDHDESIDYDKEVIAKLVLKHFPDFRRVLNELQRYSTSGEINSGVLANIKEMNLKELIDSLREKNFSKMRQWVVANVDNDPATVYRKIYDELYTVVDKGSIPQAVLTIAEYQYKSAFVADQEINLVACLVELMAECEFV